MTTANEQLADLAIRHAISLTRFGNGVERDILKLLASVDADIVKRIGGQLASMPQGAGYPYNTATEKRLHDLLIEIRKVSADVYSKGYDRLVSDLDDFAGVEAAFQAKAIDVALPVNYCAKLPSPPLLRTIASERPFDGWLLKDHFVGMAKGKVDRMERAIRVGMVEGQGAEKIVARVVSDTSEYGFEVSRRSARSVVRTSLNHVGNQVAQETWRQNSDVVKGWQFVATLDSRTSLICAGLDGQVFKVGEGPVPPRHRHCRSISIAVTKSFDELGIDKKDYTPEQRASMDGQVAASKSFETWLKGKPEDFQRKFLGPARYDLWKGGDFELRQFVRDSREVISLGDLKKLTDKMSG